jgi:hypothetical protein
MTSNQEKFQSSVVVVVVVVVVNLYRCTVHSEIYTVHSPTNVLFIKLGKV